ncbi:MAG TPA: hypothetical protein VGX23_08085 [Actinocrinis sp.]|nr:hypothetical protein [Actinocrinis sp.]
MMSGRAPDGQAGDEAVPPTVTPDQGVREAEGFVNHAWAELLHSRRAHMESALAAAIECCDTAYRHVAAAQRKGDPKAISAAHATLEKALDLARSTSVACDRTRRAGYGELTWLGREIDGYAAAAETTEPEQQGPQTAGRDRAASDPARRAGEISAVRRSFCHVRRWLARVLLQNESLAPRPAPTRRKSV